MECNATKFLAQFVRDEGLISIQDAIAKMTSMPADRLGIENRGRLACGMQADIVVFDLADLKANATRSNPNILAQGMSYVLFNGAIVIDHGSFTNVLNGQAIRHQLFYKKGGLLI